MDGGNLAGAQPLFEAEVEIGGVNADEDGWRIGQQPLIKLPSNTEQFREMTQDLY